MREKKRDEEEVSDFMNGTSGFIWIHTYTHNKRENTREKQRK